MGGGNPRLGGCVPAVAVALAPESERPVLVPGEVWLRRGDAPLSRRMASLPVPPTLAGTAGAYSHTFGLLVSPSSGPRMPREYPPCGEPERLCHAAAHGPPVGRLARRPGSRRVSIQPRRKRLNSNGIIGRQGRLRSSRILLNRAPNPRPRVTESKCCALRARPRGPHRGLGRNPRVLSVGNTSSLKR